MLGPLIGLVVLGLLVAINERFAAVPGGYSNVVERVTRRSPVFGWKGWLLVGVLAGHRCSGCSRAAVRSPRATAG